MNLTMTSDRDGTTDDGRAINSGASVVYLSHVTGGMVRVRFEDGTEGVMHPHCFPTLRDEAGARQVKP